MVTQIIQVKVAQSAEQSLSADLSKELADFDNNAGC